MSVPKTWATAELVPATTMNAEIRDRINALALAKAVVIGIGDFAGAPILPGVKTYFEMPFGMRILAWRLFADVVGSIVIDVWKDTYANFPPTAADTIAGSEKPTLVAAQKAEDLSLSTWMTDIAQGDVIGVNVDSATTVKQVTLTLRGVLLSQV
jgi:hypothetical protein